MYLLSYRNDVEEPKYSETNRHSIDLNTSGNDCFAIDLYRYDKKAGGSAVEERYQTHLPKFEDSNVGQKVENAPPKTKYNRSDTQAVHMPGPPPLDGFTSMQRGEKSSQKAISREGDDTKRTEPTQANVKKADHSEGGVVPLKLPALPFKINDTNKQGNAKLGPLQEEECPITSHGNKNGNREEIHDSKIEAIRNENDANSRQWMKVENRHVRQRRASDFRRSLPLAFDHTKRLLYNEAYCMQKMHFTNNHTFSFFNMHPAYEEHNESLATGANRIQITKYKPKSKKLHNAKSPKTEL